MSEHDEAIRRLEVQLEEKQAEAEARAREWRAATGHFLARRYQELVTSAVTEEYPETAQELGRDGLGALKAELKDLMDGVDRVVQEECAADELWAHRTDDSRLSSYRYKGHSSPLDKALRHALGRVAPLLVERNLAERDRSWSRDTDGWYWAYALDGDEEMEGRIAEYAAVLDDLQEVTQRLENARTAKERAAAQSIWEDL